MDAWLRLVPGWVWLLSLVVIGGGQQLRVSWAQADAAGARGELADYRLEVSERDRRADAQARTEEQRRQKAVDEVGNEAEGKLEVARADAARSGDALQRLQRRFDEAERRSRTCGNSVTAQLSQAAEGEARMRADLLGRVGEAARLYAAEADERGVAGRACERAYESIRNVDP
ncbi:DUF2514 family protein [Metapseudomonas lalkuanensis]|uniref:DUF2514 family protein n=1 Tax=Metapseudomonas lalkuanensis TaxID=2604832 RepID=A0A5J6QMP8_9GAMM|nr:DUF2514 family protein [Pseudomonas lalkuanensis]QEY62561.1 DUF2514 family protein [Pseudomonas lalkuanensis]